MAKYDTKQKFAAGLRNVDDRIGRVMSDAQQLALFDKAFVGRVTELWERWRVFKRKGAQELDKMFGDWDDMTDTLDLYDREVSGYESALTRKLAEKKAAPPAPPPGRVPGTAPRARRKKRTATASPQQAPDIPLVPVAPRPPARTDEEVLPRAVKQNMGPIIGAFAVGAVVLFVVVKGKKR